MRVEILRQRSREEEPYLQVFNYDGSMEGTVASLLDDLNYRDDLFDVDGNSAPVIQWECSCMQGMCGSCAMVINNRPALACETFLRDLKGDVLKLRPLHKFPVVCDLKVDRSIINNYLRTSNAYIEEYNYKEVGNKKKRSSVKKVREDSDTLLMEYNIAKCLKCGLCLEICPNYVRGQKFYGALFAGDSYLIYLRSENNYENIRKMYSEHFAAGCSKALSCMKVCPMDIPTLSSMARMNKGL